GDQHALVCASGMPPPTPVTAASCARRVPSDTPAAAQLPRRGRACRGSCAPHPAARSQPRPARLGLGLRAMRWAAVSLVFLVGCRFDLPEIGVDGVDAPGGEGNPNCMLWTTRGGHVSDLCTMPP